MSIVQPTKVSLRTCTIAGVPWLQMGNGVLVENFAVHSIRIYEDMCKPYFTGQLVIEDQLNRTDPYLYPMSEVKIAFMTEPGNKYYAETFRIYSIESKPKENDLYAGMLITINLIGAEYYNDTQNTVMQNFANVPATAAASMIHQQYIAENGGLNLSPSKGMIGLQEHPHQVMNMKPIKAIHDLLDKAISVTVATSAFTYFRNKPGYVMKPLEELLTSAPMAGPRFVHKPAAGASLKEVLTGYENIIHLRPMAPPSQDSAAGPRSAELDSLLKTTSFFDAKTGNFLNKVGSLGMKNTLKALTQNAKQDQIKELMQVADALMGKSVKTQFGARMLFNVINEDRQQRTVDKNGPGGYNTAEEAFLAALNFSKKYWVSAPIQTGIDVTVGNRINVLYPVGTRTQTKTLFIARLIHEVQFKTPGQKRFEPAQGSTEMYGVEWG